jgi:hypothetical protein
VSNQKGIENIGRIAREGLQCMGIERGGSGHNAFSRIGASKMAKPPTRLVSTMIPPPKIYFQRGQLEVYNRSEPVQISTRETADTRRYIEGNVSTAWKTAPWIKVSYVSGIPPKGAIVDSLV